MIELSDEQMQEIGDKISTLILKNKKDIMKSFKASETDKYTFAINVAMRDAQRDGVDVLVIQPSLRWSEKHRDDEEVILENADQLRMVK